jgi:hypothetical protein
MNTPTHMKSHLQSLGLYPLPKQTPSEKLAAQTPLSPEQLAAECIIAETNAAGIPKLDPNDSNPEASLVFYFSDDLFQRDPLVSEHFDIPPTPDMDFIQELEHIFSEKSGMKSLYAEFITYVREDNISVCMLSTSKIRKYFHEIGLGSPESILAA